MELAHDELGDGPAVVLLHAGVADRTMWSELLPVLADAGHRAIALDLPGHGDSGGAGHSPQDAVVETLEALRVDRAVLVGNSFGGAVALIVAAIAPERVSGLVLVSAPAPGLEPSAELEAAWEAEESAFERGDVEGALAAVLDAWTLPDAPPELRERISAMQRRAYESQDPAAEASLEDPLEDDPSLVSRIDVPSLVAVGEHDMEDFRRGAESLARDLPDARHVVIPRAGHLAPLEQPEAFRDLVLEYLHANSGG